MSIMLWKSEHNNANIKKVSQVVDVHTTDFFLQVDSGFEKIVMYYAPLIRAFTAKVPEKRALIASLFRNHRKQLLAKVLCVQFLTLPR